MVLPTGGAETVTFPPPKRNFLHVGKPLLSLHGGGGKGGIRRQEEEGGKVMVVVVLLFCHESPPLLLFLSSPLSGKAGKPLTRDGARWKRGRGKKGRRLSGRSRKPPFSSPPPTKVRAIHYAAASPPRMGSGGRHQQAAVSLPETPMVVPRAFWSLGDPLSLLTLKKRGGRGTSRGGGGGGDLVPPPADDDGVGPPADYQIVPPPTVAANVTALMMGGIDHTKRLRFLLLRVVAGKTPKLFSFFASSFGGEKNRRLLPLPRCNNNGEGGKRRRRKRRRRPMTTSSSPCLSCCRSPKHTGKNGQQAQDAPRTQREGEKLLSSLPIHRKRNAEYFSSHKRIFPSSVARKGRRRRSRHAQNGTTGIRGVFFAPFVSQNSSPRFWKVLRSTFFFHYYPVWGEQLLSPRKTPLEKKGNHAPSFSSCVCTYDHSE